MCNNHLYDNINLSYTNNNNSLKEFYISKQTKFKKDNKPFQGYLNYSKNDTFEINFKHNLIYKNLKKNKNL